MHDGPYARFGSERRSANSVARSIPGSGPCRNQLDGYARTLFDSVRTTWLCAGFKFSRMSIHMAESTRSGPDKGDDIDIQIERGPSPC
jgi:hypothetical protein